MKIEHYATLLLTLTDDEVHVFCDVLKAAAAVKRGSINKTAERIVKFCDEALLSIFPECGN